MSVTASLQQMPAKQINTSRWAAALLTEASFLKYSHLLILTFCFIVNLSIGPAQISLGLLILYWLAFYKTTGRSFELKPNQRYVYVPLCGWVITSFIASCVGVDFGRAIIEFVKTSFYLIAPLAISDSLHLSNKRPTLFNFRFRSYLFALICGQCVASLYGVLNHAFGFNLTLHPPGAVTASGQLVLILCALLALLDQPPLKESDGKGHFITLKESLYFCCCVFVLLLGVWPALLPFSVNKTLASSLIIGSMALVAILSSHREIARLARWPSLVAKIRNVELRKLLFIALCLLAVSFIINLKRGPWLGFSAALFSICILYARRVVIIMALLAGIFLLSLQPIQQRVFKFADDFTISGGRQYMWELGAELVERYPLGVGLDNARVMQKLDPTLPKLHRHMHSNFLNIAVETGWIGLMMFIWWFLRVLKLGWGEWRTYTFTPDKPGQINPGWILIITAGLFGWQIAGLVEYNFGDGEIVLIAWLFLGLLLAIADNKSIKSSRVSPNESAAQCPAPKAS